MTEEVKGDAPAAEPVKEVVQSPPAAEVSVRKEEDGPRVRLHQLVELLTRAQNRRLLVEYLRLRRAVR